MILLLAGLLCPAGLAIGNPDDGPDSAARESGAEREAALPDPDRSGDFDVDGDGRLDAGERALMRNEMRSRSGGGRGDGAEGGQGEEPEKKGPSWRGWLEGSGALDGGGPRAGGQRGP